MYRYNVENSKDGYEILKVIDENKTVYIGSRYNEKREIDKFITQLGLMTEADVYIVLGLGMGNHLVELAGLKHPSTKIMVIDTPEWIKEFRKSHMKDGLEQVYFASSVSEMEEFLYKNINEFNIGYLKIGSYANYDKLFKDKLIDIYNFIRDYKSSLQITINTKLNFANIWFNSTVKNLKYLYQTDLISEYRNKHKNKPAIIVSAGPSLNNNIDVLKNNKSAMIFTGGRTLKSLMGIGVKPDYLAIVDPMDKSYELVEGHIDKLDTNLIYNLGISNDILENQRGRRILYDKKKEVAEIVNKHVGNLISGGSVAHILTNAAIVMGCNPIIFIGQDFAYTDDKGHAEVAGSPWETVDIDNYKSNTDIYVRAIDGGTVRTSTLLNKYKCEMEKIIDGCPSVNFINATEGGALINGAENKKLSEIIEKYNNIDLKDIVSFKCNDNNLEIKKRLTLRLKKSATAMEKSIKLYDDAIKVLKEYEKSVRTGNKNENNFKEKLRKLDTSIYKLSDDIIFCDEILYPVMYRSNVCKDYIITVQDDERAGKIKIIKNNLELYANIKKVFVDNLDFIKTTLDNIN